MGCEPLARTEHKKKSLELMRLFDKKLGRYYGKIFEHDPYAQKAIREMAWYKLQKPLHAEWTLNEPEFKRLENAIEAEARDWEGGRVSAVRRFTFVPDAITNKTIATRQWSGELDKAVNYEQDKHGKFEDQRLIIAEHLRTAFLSGADMSKRQIKDLDKKRSKFERKIITALLNGDASLVGEYYREMQKIVGEKSGDILSDFLWVMEESGAFSKNGSRSDAFVRIVENEKGIKKEREIHDSVISAAEVARHTLDMGADVAVRGLERLKSNLERTYEGYGLAEPTRIFKEIDNTIKTIGKQKKDGDYFPHYVLDKLPKIMSEFDKYMAGENNKNAREKSLAEIGSLLPTLNTPDHLRARGSMSRQLMEVNPIGVMGKYMNEIIAFNKIQHIQGAYGKVMKHFPKDKNSGVFAESMREFLNHQFITATEGYQNRPDWVNKMTRMIGAYETVSKLALGIPTAARNLLTGTYFISQVGWNAYFKSRGNIRKAGEGSALGQELAKAEQEQGFLFSQVISPIFTEGLLPTEGVKRQEIRFDIQSGTFEVQKEGSWQAIDKVINLTVGKGMILQRVTENYLRKEMFRTAFEQMYGKLSANKRYADSVGDATIRRKSINAGLKMVSDFAFGYDIHNKAPVIGGSHKTLGALGQSAMHFMHFPMKFLNLQFGVYRNFIEAAKAGQWNSYEIATAARFASISALTALFSGLLNADLTHLMENDSISRVQDMYDYMTADDEEEREKIMYGRGPIQSFMGPFVSDIILAGNILQFYEMPDDEWGKILLGYQDIYDQDEDVAMRRSLSLINVEMSRWANKNIPAISDGRGWSILNHEFGVYPRAWTKKVHKKVWGDTKKVEMTDAEKQLLSLARSLKR